MRIRIVTRWAMAVTAFSWFYTAGKVGSAQEDVVDIPSEAFRAENDEHKRYFLIGAKPQAKVPNAGYRLLVVMPGGDGGPDFNPFLRRILKHGLTDKYLIAQLVAVKWTPDQQIVWPTLNNKVPKQKISTEEFVEAVIKDVRGKHKVDDRYIFTLSWSSGGPAGYAASLRPKTPVTGSYIAMSVFKPDLLPPLERGKGHAYVIDHSPDDRVCPFRMAKAAEAELTQHGAKVKMLEYPGGHGWRGNVFNRIQTGIRWLEQMARRQRKSKPADP